MRKGIDILEDIILDKINLTIKIIDNNIQNTNTKLINEIATFFARENRSNFQKLMMHEIFENFKMSLRE